jgi:hypothetical protein
VAASPATGQSEPGSGETLGLSAGSERGVGEELRISAEGKADGAHRLFVFGERSSCAGWPPKKKQRTRWS